MKKFKISWTERVGYSTTIEAESKEAALDAFFHGELTDTEENHFTEIEEDSEVIEEVTE